MLVSRYAGYGAYDTKSVSTYNNPDNASSIESADSLNAQAAGIEGATRDYEDINVGKALSDMKKDAVLDKYKFFVDSPNLGTDNDGTVRIVRR